MKTKTKIMAKVGLNITPTIEHGKPKNNNTKNARQKCKWNYYYNLWKHKPKMKQTRLDYGARL